MAKHPQLVANQSTVRTLPNRLHPQLGESFGSYMERLSSKYQTPLASMLSAVALVRETSDPVIPGWGLTMSEKQLDDFVLATRLPLPMVKAMLLKCFDGTFINLADVNVGEPQTFRRAAAREWFKMAGSRFCPSCIGEVPHAWQLRWKLNWSFACVKHNQILRDECQACDRTAGMGRGDMTATPAYLGKVAKPGCCNNTLGGMRGTNSKPCGSKLWTQKSIELPEFSKVIEAQRSIDKHIDIVLDGGMTPSDVARVSNFASETRSLAALILMIGDAELFCCEGVELNRAVNDHVQLQKLAKQARGRDDSVGSRQRVFSTTGMSAKLTAAAMVPAVRLALLSEQDDLVSSLKPLVTRFKSESNVDLRQVIDDFQFTDRLAFACKTALTTTSSFGRISKVHPTQPNRIESEFFGAKHIPQIVPESIYRQRFMPMLPRVLEMTGRRFVSVAAVKSFGCCWDQAAQKIDLPLEAGQFSKKAIPLINRLCLTERFVLEVNRWMDEIQSDEMRPDFAQRRLALSGLIDIPAPVWGTFCGQAGIDQYGPPMLSRFAAAWLWAELTQGDWRLSPAMKYMVNVPRVRDEYRRLIPRIGELLALLKPHGSELLMAQGDRSLNCIGEGE